MRRSLTCIVLAAAAGLAACATDGAGTALPALAGPADPCAAGALGCATEANLRAMIADPADLALGAEPGASSGDAAVASAAPPGA